MSLSIYKPNSKNTGCGFSFQCGKDGKTGNSSLYIKSIQQHSWDDKKKQGYFQKNIGDAEKNITLKFNEYEVGEMIHALSNRSEYSTFHSFGEDKTVIKFVPWDKPVKNSDNKSPCFGVSFTRNGNQSFKISLEPGEIQALIQFFKFILNSIFSERSLYYKAKSTYQETEEAPF